MKNFNKPLCRNCQDWIRRNNKYPIEKSSITDLPDYNKLVNFIRLEIANNKPYNYEITYKNGDTINYKSDILINNYAKIKYHGKTFQIIESNSSTIKCSEIPDCYYDTWLPQKYSIETLNYEQQITDFFAKRGYNIRKNSLSEESFTTLILECLEPYFEIRKEVWGTHCTGKKVKIDAILKPKKNNDWRNKELVIGLEIKNPLIWETNNRRDTDLYAQCLDYSMSRFSGVKDMIVLLCPLPPKFLNDKMLRFVSRYNVGHLDLKEKNGICFFIGGQQIWVENKETGHAVGILTQSLLKQKFGNRGGK